MTGDLTILSATDYQAAAKALLPRGRALASATVFDKLWLAIADILAALHADAIQLVNVESDPATTEAMLSDFEACWGLPDPCITTPADVNARRRILVARIGDKGGMSAQQFVDIAASVGFTVTVDELHPFTCESPCDAPVYDIDARFVWRMNVPEPPVITVMTCTEPCDSPLRSWGEQPLECAVRLRNRASRTVLFAYTG